MASVIATAEIIDKVRSGTNSVGRYAFLTARDVFYKEGERQLGAVLRNIVVRDDAVNVVEHLGPGDSVKFTAYLNWDQSDYYIGKNGKGAYMPVFNVRDIEVVDGDGDPVDVASDPDEELPF